MKKIWFLVVALLCFAYSQQANPQGNTAKQPTKDSTNQNISLTGYWVWEKNSDASDFDVEITKKGNAYIGEYCATAYHGNRIDCGRANDPPSFKIENIQGNEFTVAFKTYYGGGTGKVKIRIEGDTMYWEIVKKPKGEYYCPDAAVLKRTKK